jgi:hypothetical protein
MSGSTGTFTGKRRRAPNLSHLWTHRSTEKKRTSQDLKNKKEKKIKKL